MRVMVRDRSVPAVDHLRSLGAEIVSGDMLDSSSFSPALSGCDSLIHLAAWFEIGTGDRAGMMAVNVDGLDKLLVAAGAHQLERIVIAGSVLSFGPTETGCQPASPPGPTKLTAGPRSRYTGPFEESKHRALQVALMHAAAGLPVVIVCPGTVLGPEDPSQVGTALRLATQGKLPLLLGGRSCFSFLSLEDAVNGFERAFEKGRPGEIYTLVSEVLSLEDVVQITCRLAHVAPPRWGATGRAAWLGGAMVNLVSRLRGGRRIYDREALAVVSSDWGYRSEKSRHDLDWHPEPVAQALRRIGEHHADRSR